MLLNPIAMPRGGSRKGAGRPSVWASGCTREDTKPVRIPKAIVDQVLEYAHRLDAGETFDLNMQSEDINLPDKKRLYKLRDKVLSHGVGKYASTSPHVKEISKKFTQFIKALYSGDY